jgi:hypothetical protein
MNRLTDSYQTEFARMDGDLKFVNLAVTVCPFLKDPRYREPDGHSKPFFLLEE